MTKSRKIITLLASLLMILCSGCLTTESEKNCENDLNQGTSVAAANTYFVDQNHPAASDDNPGTEELPLKTINGSLKHVKPGVTVWIKKGNYREMVLMASYRFNYSRPKNYIYDKKLLAKIKYRIVPSGKNFSQMINFLAWPGDEVFIKGSDVVKGWKKFKDNIYVHENWPYNSQQVFVDDKRLQQIAGSPNPGLTMRGRWRGRKGAGLADMEENSFYCDLKSKKLYVWLAKGDNPKNHLIEVGVRSHLWDMRKLDYFKIVGIKMRHANTSACLGHSPVMIHGNFNLIENIESSWNDFGGLSLRGKGTTLVNCKMNHNGFCGLGADGRGFRIINCETSYNNYRHFNPSWAGGGVKIIPYCHDTIVDGHVAAYNIGPGIWFDAFNSNITIENSIAHNNTGPGIFYEISEHGVIKNNLCYDNRGRGIYVSNSAYTAVLHNICYHNGMSGIVVIGVKRQDCGVYGRGKEKAWPSWGNLVWGNILMDNCHPDLCPKGWSGRAELIMPNSDLSINAFNRSDYNVFYRSGDRKVKIWEGYGAKTYTLEEWAEKTGNGKHSIIAKPTFVNLAKRDFHPKSDSPALWFVKPDPNIYFDKDEKKRPKGFRSAGPYTADEKWRKETIAKGSSKSDKHTIIIIPSKLKTNIVINDRTLDPIRFAGRAFETESLGGGVMGVKVDGIPFAYTSKRKGVRLCKETPVIEIPIDKMVKSMHILLGAVTNKKGPLFECVIERQDGHKVKLLWEDGKNITSSQGPWPNKLVDLPDSKLKTREAGRYMLNKKPVRQFIATWDNENEWYPVKSLTFKLLNDDGQVVINGITVE